PAAVADRVAAGGEWAAGSERAVARLAAQGAAPLRLIAAGIEDAQLIHGTLCAGRAAADPARGAGVEIEAAGLEADGLGKRARVFVAAAPVAAVVVGAADLRIADSAIGERARLDGEIARPDAEIVVRRQGRRRATGDERHRERGAHAS